MKHRIVAVGLVLVAAAAAAGCSIWGPEGGPGGAGIAADPAPTSTPVVAVAGPDGVQRVEVTVGDNLRFTPSFVQAHPGVVEFVFHNDGSTAHDISIEPGSGSTGTVSTGTVSTGTVSTGNLNGGQTRTVRITVDQPGRYPFPCLYHISSGMQGTLEVL